MEKQQKEQKNYWFRKRRFGWEFVPATWQGWVILAFYLATFVYYAVYVTGHTPSEVFIAALGMFVITAVLLAICLKTGEPQ